VDTRLVRIIARKFSNTQIPEEDLVQEGMLALIRAHNTFNVDMGVKFETYASRVIKNRYIDLLRRKTESTSKFNDETTQTDQSFDDEINLIEIKKILASHINDIERAIFNSYIEGFTYEEISKIFDLPRKKIDNIIAKVKKIIKSYI